MLDVNGPACLKNSNGRGTYRFVTDTKSVKYESPYGVVVTGSSYFLHVSVH
jgi:hypothetical protein